MKIIKNQYDCYRRFKELVVEKKFLFIKWRVVYRMFGTSIFKYKGDDKYSRLSVISENDLFPYFDIQPDEPIEK